MNRIKKEDYITDEIKELEKQIVVKTKEEKERAIVKKILSKIPLERKKVMLQELSLEFAVK